MPELKMRIVTIHEVFEHAIGGGTRVHGVFDSQEEADRRYGELARQWPTLVQSGSIGVRTRRAEVLEPVEPPTAEKMRRPGRDGYEDKGYAPNPTERTLR